MLIASNAICLVLPLFSEMFPVVSNRLDRGKFRSRNTRQLRIKYGNKECDISAVGTLKDFFPFRKKCKKNGTFYWAVNRLVTQEQPVKNILKVNVSQWFDLSGMKLQSSFPI